MTEHLDGREFLSQASLLPQLDRAEREELLAVARRRAYAARQVVVRKGDAASEAFGILRGRLKAVTTSADGKELALSIMGPGEVVGEIALLTDAERSATIIAIEDCELLCIDRRNFFAFLDRRPRVAICMLSALAARVRTLTALVEDTQFLNLPSRLAKKLLDLSAKYGARSGEGLSLDLALSQQELGDLVGTTRESVNKQIRAWVAEGVIRWERGRITIREPDRLESEAGTLLL